MTDPNVWLLEAMEALSLIEKGGDPNRNEANALKAAQRFKDLSLWLKTCGSYWPKVEKVVGKIDARGSEPAYLCEAFYVPVEEPADV